MACRSKDAAKEPVKGMIQKKDRKCRDVICCLFFIVFWIGMVVIAAIGLKEGEPKRLFYGTDYRGKLCGVDSGVEDRKRIIYPRTNEDFLINFAETNPLKYKFYGICVDECPKTTGNRTIGDQSTTIPGIVCNNEPVAEADGQPSAFDFLDSSADKVRECMKGTSAEPYCATLRENCWWVPQDTSSVMWRCIPLYDYKTEDTATCIYPEGITKASDDECILVVETTNEKTVKPAKPNYLFDQLNDARAVWSRYFGDLENTWMVILVCGGFFSLVLGFAWLCFLRCCAGVMVWVSVILVVIGMVALTFFCYFKAGILTGDHLESIQDQIALEKDTEGEISQRLQTSENYKKTFKYAAYIFTALTLIMLCIIVALRSKINLAIKVVQRGSKALQSNPALVLYPFVTVGIVLALLAYWVFVAAALASAGEITTADVSANVDASLKELQESNDYVNSLMNDANVTAAAKKSFAVVEERDWTKHMLGYHFFGLLWTVQVIHGIGLLTVAAAIGGWYFSRPRKGDKSEDRYKQPFCTTCASLGLAFRYYFGTIAFGGLLIALVQFVRVILAYMQRQLKKSDNKCIKAVLCCLSCCLKCTQTLLEVVTRNAYIIVAVKGTGFIQSGARVFRMIRDHFVELAVVNLIGEIILFLSKLFVACASAFMCFYWLDNQPEFQEGGDKEISSEWLPVLLTMLFAFAIATGFFSVFDMTMDTVLVCYIIDVDENGAPTYMDGKFVGDHRSYAGEKHGEEAKASKGSKQSELAVMNPMPGRQAASPTQ